MLGTFCCKLIIGTLLVAVFIVESKQQNSRTINMAELLQLGCPRDTEEVCLHGSYRYKESRFCAEVEMCYRGLNQSCDVDTIGANRRRCKPNLSCTSCRVCQNCDGNKCDSTLCPMSNEKKRWMRPRLPFWSQLDSAARPQRLDYKPVVPNSWDYPAGSDEMYPQ